MAKKYFPKSGERFKVFIKIPALKGRVFVCTGKCYHYGFANCVEAKELKGTKPEFAFNKHDFEFEKI